MGDVFDPRREWLQVPAESDSPTHYDLLGLAPFEDRWDRIRDGYWTRYELVRKYEVGSYSEHALALMDELSRAFQCLSNAETKRRYDEELRKIPSDSAANATRADATQAVDGLSNSATSPSLARGLSSPPEGVAAADHLGTPIEFACAQCGQQLRTGADTGGKLSRCPTCGQIQSVPTWTATSPPRPPLAESYRFADEASAALHGAKPLPPLPPPVAATGIPLNPYAAPKTMGYAADVRDAAYASNRVRGPALALMIVSGLSLALALLSLAASVADLPRSSDEGWEILGVLAFNVLLPGFVFFGAYRMRQLQSFGLAVTASLCALTPCLTCCVLSMPFGIWSLVVLSDSHVRHAFR